METANLELASKRIAKKRLRALVYLFLIVSIGIGAFLNEAIAFFNEPNNLWMNDTEFFLTFTASLISALCYIFFAHRFAGARAKPFYIILFLLLFIGDVIALFIFPETKTGTITRYTGAVQGYVYSITAMEKVRDALMFGMSCLYFYMIFAILPQTVSSKHTLNFILYAVVFVTAFVIVWSLVNEREVYAKYADIHAEITTSDYVSSCFYNRNTYGTFLLLGICCLGYLQCESRHVWNYILMAIFSLANLITLSKTSIIGAVIFISAFAIFRFIQTFKYHKIKNIITAVLLIGVIIFLAIARTSDIEVLNNNLFTKLYGNFADSLSRRLEGTFLEDRTEIWISSYGMLDTPMAKIFGLGEINLYFLLGNAWGKFSDAVPLYWTHNGIAHALAAGGYFRLAIYAITIGIFIVKDVKLILRKSSTAIVSMLFFITFLIHGMTETTGFLMPDTKGLVLLILVYGPVFAEDEKKDSFSLADNFTGRVKYRYTLSPVSKTALWLLAVSPWLLYALAVAPVLIAMRIDVPYSTSFVPLAAILALSMPLYFFLSYTVKQGFFGFLARMFFLGVGTASFILMPIYENATFLLIPALAIPLGVALLAAMNVKDLSRGHWGRFWRLFIVDVLVKVVFIGANHVAFLFFATREFVITPTSIAVYIIASVLFAFFLLAATPLSDIYLYPLNHMAIHLDDKIGISMRRYANWIDERNGKYLNPPKKEKRINHWVPQN